MSKRQSMATCLPFSFISVTLYLESLNPEYACFVISWRLLVLATPPGIFSPHFFIMENHLLNEAFHDYPSTRPNIEWDRISSGFSRLSQQAVEILLYRIWALNQCLKQPLHRTKSTLENPFIPLQYSMNGFVESTLHLSHLYACSCSRRFQLH